MIEKLEFNSIELVFIDEVVVISFIEFVFFVGDLLFMDLDSVELIILLNELFVVNNVFEVIIMEVLES